MTTRVLSQEKRSFALNITLVVFRRKKKLINIKLDRKGQKYQAIHPTRNHKFIKIEERNTNSQ